MKKKKLVEEIPPEETVDVSITEEPIEDIVEDIAEDVAEDVAEDRTIIESTDEFAEKSKSEESEESEESIKETPEESPEAAVEKQEETLDNSGKSELYLTFYLKSDLYGIPVKFTREVMDYGQVFKTPGVPDYIKGVINLRGEVVPVIDLSSRFYNIKSEVTERTAIIIVEIEYNDEVIPIGMMIDSIDSAIDIYENNIEVRPEIGAKIRADFIAGIGKAANEFIILLNPGTVMNISELSDLDGNSRK